jgi:hypothetical protein
MAGVPPAAVIRLGRFVAADETWLWAGTEGAGLWLSRDAGQSWLFGGLNDRSVYSLFVDPLDPVSLIAATDMGVMKTAWR